MTDIIDPVDDAAAEVPEPVVTPDPEPEPEHHEDHHGSSRPEWVDEIIGAVNSIKEASPITPVEDEVLDKSPVRPPWTHRGLFKKG